MCVLDGFPRSTLSLREKLFSRAGILNTVDGTVIDSTVLISNVVRAMKTWSSSASSADTILLRVTWTRLLLNITIQEIVILFLARFYSTARSQEDSFKTRRRMF